MHDKDKLFRRIYIVHSFKYKFFVWLHTYISNHIQFKYYMLKKKLFLYRFNKSNMNHLDYENHAYLQL